MHKDGALISIIADGQARRMVVPTRGGSGDMKRLTTWMAIAALAAQFLLPAAVPARAEGTVVICTSAGLVAIPGQAIPLGPADRAGSKHGAACHAVCPSCGGRRRVGRRTPVRGR